MRRCVGCGRVAPKPLLVRVALAAREEAGARVTIDAAGRMAGRGAYLCRADTHNAPHGDPAGERVSRSSGDPAAEDASRPSGDPAAEDASRPSGDPASEDASRPSGNLASEDASRPSGECFQRALRRRAFARAFRQSVDVPAKLIESVGP